MSFYNNPENQTIGGHKRLVTYLRSFLAGFSYKGETYNADLASTEQANNGLQLAILTKTYASLVGVRGMSTSAMSTNSVSILAI